METKSLTVMFVDMKGFTSMTSTLSRKQIAHLLDTFERLVQPSVLEFSGNIVKSMGDGYLVSFESPTNAVLCGMKIQEGVSTHNTISPAEEFFELRVAINTGEVLFKNGDVFGETVNLASRVEMVAEPGEVYFTETVNLAMNQNEIPSQKVARGKLKGIPGNIRIYKVSREQSQTVKNKILRGRQALESYFLPKDKITVASAQRKVKFSPQRHFKYLLLVFGAFLIFGWSLTAKGEKSQTSPQLFISDPVLKDKGEVQGKETSSPTSGVLPPRQTTTPSPTPKPERKEKGWGDDKRDRFFKLELD